MVDRTASFSKKFHQLVTSLLLTYVQLVQCFDAVGWVAGRASGL